MHSFSVEEVAHPDFDVSKLSFEEEDINALRQELTPIFDKALENNRKRFLPGNYYYDNITAQDVFCKIKLSDQAFLAFTFDSSLMEKILKDTPMSGWFNYFQYLVRDFIVRHPILGDKIFSSSGNKLFSAVMFDFRYVNNSLAISAVKEKGVNDFSDFNLFFLLDLMPPEEATIFLESKSGDVRLAAYKKLGAMNYIDQMLIDSSAEIRKYAATIMDYGDPRYKMLVKEKTKGALQLAISRCSPGILPLFLGNNLVKKDYDIKSIFERRMGK